MAISPQKRITIPTKLKLYNTCILPSFLYGSECWAVTKRDTQDRRPRPMMFAKVVRSQMRAEWRSETDNRATTPVGYCPNTASFSVRPYCKNARRGRC